MWLTHLRLQVECSDPAQQGGEFNLTRIHLASYSFFSYSSYSPSPASKLVRSLYVSLSPNLVSRANPACYSSSRPRGSCSFMRDQRSATDSRPVLRKPAAVEASTSKQRVQTSLFVQRRRQCVTIWSAPRTVSTTNIEGHTLAQEVLCPAQAPRPDCGLMCRPEWRTQCRTPTTSLGVVPISCSARADVSLCALSVVLAGQCTVPFSDQVWASWRWMRLNLLTSALYHMQGPDSKRFLNLIHAYINVLLFHNLLILELW